MVYLSWSWVITRRSKGIVQVRFHSTYIISIDIMDCVSVPIIRKYELKLRTNSNGFQKITYTNLGLITIN